MQPRQKITFNSIVLPKTAAHLLALRVLKSYLHHQGAQEYYDICCQLFTTDQSDQVIAQQILAQGGRIAAFSIYPWNVDQITEVCRRLKGRQGQPVIIVGGPYAGFRASELMASGAFDFLVRGPGEETLYRLLEMLRQEDHDFDKLPNLYYRHSGRVIATARADVFDISQQSYPLLVESDERSIFYYETSRGCPFSCRFCAWNEGPPRLRFYPPDKIMGDLTTIFNHPQVNYLGLCDSDIFHNRGHGLWLLQYIRGLNAQRRTRGLGEINLLFEINPERLTDEIIDEMLRLPDGFNVISCGLQTIDEEVNCRHLNRRFNRARYIDRLQRLFARAKEQRRLEQIKKYFNIEIIYGLPGETYEGFRRTVDFILSELGVANFLCFRFSVLPGSYFWDHAEDYGLRYDQQAPHYLLSSNSFPSAQMEQAKRLVFFLYMFMMLFKGIIKFVERQVPDNQLAVYDQIIDRLSRQYPEFIEDLYRNFHEDDNEALLQMLQQRTDKGHLEQRYQIVRLARQVVQEQVRGSAQPGKLDETDRL